MIRQIYVRIILCFVPIIVGLCCSEAQSQQVGRIDLGREEPFAKLPEERKISASPAPAGTAGTSEHKSELFVEIAILKSLNAGSLKAVIGDMLSEYGSISIDERTNSLIICDRRENLEKILTEIGKADETAIPLPAVPQDNLRPELFVETVTLKFLNAKNLKTAISKMSSEHGSVSIDEKTNSLIICDTKENLEKMLDEIRKADQTPEQIMVEVVILDVKLEDDTEIGVDWNRLFKPERDETYVQTLIPTTSTTGVDFSIIKRDIIGTVHALQEIRNVEILASPRVLVVSGWEAYIQTIEEIPYIELSQSSGGVGGTDALTSTEFKEAGITLRVKATVTDERKILMTIEPEQSVNTGVAGVGDSTVPIVDKRKAGTTLLMEDGQVLVMGGLRKKEIRTTRDQVPLLGDLPLVGFLFAYDKKEVRHTELLILISPHIYRGEPAPEDVMAKFKEITDRPMLSLPENIE